MKSLKTGSRTVSFFRFRFGLGSTAVSNFGSVPVKVQIIETLRFGIGFAPVKNNSIPVYKVPVQVRSKNWCNSSYTI